MKRALTLAVCVVLCAASCAAAQQNRRLRLPGHNDPIVAAEAVVDEWLFHAALSNFTFAHTYHVATNAVGASCSNDGLTATYSSGTNGPWPDFGCLAARQALNGNSTIVYVHAGTYNLMDSATTYGIGGLAINGTGTISSPMVLAPYPGDSPVITGNENYTYAQIHEVFTSGTMDGVAFNPNTGAHVRQVLNISGTNVIVEAGITLQYGFRHVVQISGTHVALRTSTLIGAYEDAIKVLVDARHVYLSGDCSQFASSCLDWFGAEYVYFTRFTCHDPRQDPTTGAYVAVCAGVKGGGSFGAFTHGSVYSLSSDGSHAAFILGGAPNTAIDRQDGSGNFLASVTALKVMGNTVTNFYGTACQFTGGVNSECSDNVITGTLGLAKIGTDPDVRAGDPMYATQPLTANPVLRRNRMSFLPVKCSGTVQGDACFAVNVINTAEAVGLVGDVNVYTSTASTSPAFIYGGGQIDIAAFRTASGGVETTSTVVAP